jgi:hypothetical protein
VPGLQACLRRTAHSAKVWCTAMTAVESLIAERWDTQKLLSAISQQSSLQHVATWAEFQKETRDKLAQILQVHCLCREDRAARDCAACLSFTSIALSLNQHYLGRTHWSTRFTVECSRRSRCALLVLSSRAG